MVPRKQKATSGAVKNGTKKGGQGRPAAKKRSPSLEKKSNVNSSENGSKDNESISGALLDACERLFKTRNLYEVLGISEKKEEGTNGPTQTDIRRAYYKQALAHHPDKVVLASKGRNEGGLGKAKIVETANKKFTLINQAYTILNDEEKRKLYDETGMINQDAIIDEKACRAFFHMFTSKVNSEQINDFTKTYRESEEEKKDLIELYKQFNGDWDQISERLMCYDVEDEERYKGIVKECIEQAGGEYKEERKSRANARKKRFLAEKDLTKNIDLDELINQINEKNKKRVDEFCDRIEKLFDRNKRTKGSKKMLINNDNNKNDDDDDGEEEEEEEEEAAEKAAGDRIDGRAAGGDYDYDEDDDDDDDDDDYEMDGRDDDDADYEEKKTKTNKQPKSRLGKRPARKTTKKANVAAAATITKKPRGRPPSKKKC